jgi:hypothetical protein
MNKPNEQIVDVLLKSSAVLKLIGVAALLMAVVFVYDMFVVYEGVQQQERVFAEEMAGYSYADFFEEVSTTTDIASAETVFNINNPTSRNISIGPTDFTHALLIAEGEKPVASLFYWTVLKEGYDVTKIEVFHNIERYLGNSPYGNGTTLAAVGGESYAEELHEGSYTVGMFGENFTIQYGEQKQEECRSRIPERYDNGNYTFEEICVLSTIKHYPTEINWAPFNKNVTIEPKEKQTFLVTGTWKIHLGPQSVRWDPIIMINGKAFYPPAEYSEPCKSTLNQTRLTSLQGCFWDCALNNTVNAYPAKCWLECSAGQKPACICKEGEQFTATAGCVTETYLSNPTYCERDDDCILQATCCCPTDDFVNVFHREYIDCNNAVCPTESCEPALKGRCISNRCQSPLMLGVL